MPPSLSPFRRRKSTKCFAIIDLIICIFAIGIILFVAAVLIFGDDNLINEMDGHGAFDDFATKTISENLTQAPVGLVVAISGYYLLFEIAIFVIAVRLLQAIGEDLDPKGAMGKVKCYQILNIILLVLSVIRLIGEGSAEGMLVNLISVVFRSGGLIVVSIFLKELDSENSDQKSNIEEA